MLNYNLRPQDKIKPLIISINGKTQNTKKYGQNDVQTRNNKKTDEKYKMGNKNKNKRKVIVIEVAEKLSLLINNTLACDCMCAKRVLQLCRLHAE